MPPLLNKENICLLLKYSLSTNTRMKRRKTQLTRSTATTTSLSSACWWGRYFYWLAKWSLCSDWCIISMLHDLRRNKISKINRLNETLTSPIKYCIDVSILIFSFADVSNHLSKPFSSQYLSIWFVLLTKPSLTKSH